MSPEFAPYIIVLWLLAMLAVFPSLTPHRAILIIVFSGTLFLPEAVSHAIELGPIKLGKLQAISYACLSATLLYHYHGFQGFKPQRSDWAMLIWCVWPFPSAMMNDPPPDGSSQIRDALAQTLAQSVVWGVPYLMGRLYFNRRETILDLAFWTVVAAAVYAPFCLWEVRMSPQLHSMVYGFQQHSFGQTIRYGGFRPIVFMQHGLAVGMFMVAGALLAVWLRRPAVLRAYLLLLVPVAVLVKSTGAIALGLIGGFVLWLSKATALRCWLLLLVGIPIAYTASRTTGLWTGADLVEITAANVEEDRAQSLEFRLNNENMLIRKALERSLFGWGGWGRNRVIDIDGKDISTTDGLWIIVMGDRGAIGLVALGVALLLPVVRFGMRSTPNLWHTSELAPALGCAVIVVLWVIDCLFNAMLNPLYVLMAGALAGWEPNSAGGPAADIVHEIDGDHAGQEQSISGVPAGQSEWLPRDAVQPLQPDPLHPSRGPADSAGDKVE